MTVRGEHVSWGRGAAGSSRRTAPSPEGRQGGMRIAPARGEDRPGDKELSQEPGGGGQAASHPQGGPGASEQGEGAGSPWPWEGSP